MPRKWVTSPACLWRTFWLWFLLPVSGGLDSGKGATNRNQSNHRRAPARLTHARQVTAVFDDSSLFLPWRIILQNLGHSFLHVFLLFVRLGLGINRLASQAAPDQCVVG